MKRRAAAWIFAAMAVAVAGGAVARSAGMLVPARAKQAAEGTMVPEPKIGPAAGTLLVAGGGSMRQIWPLFLELAGGPSAPIVVIPTANEAVEGEDRVVQMLREIGATDVVQLHTRDRAEANREDFVAPLRRARAVWLEGGRQWRLVDAYLNTLTHRELTAVLARGGVVGGTSAGASIQASYLVRGSRQNNRIMMARGYEDGFGFLRDTAIDQHVDTRRRQDDLRPVLSRHGRLLGIALDEATALIVRGDLAEIVGVGRAQFLTKPDEPPAVLKAGARFDLAARRPATVPE
jgi:cyanophycinase